MSFRHTERGFSLVELLVAVFITLIVSGAIYGLIASSETAFRRDPEMADRQQNIRIAMDMIQRDVQLAGQGMPWFAQVFTRADVAPFGECTGNLNGCGFPGTGTMGPAAAAARGGDAEEPDVLQVLSVEDQCPLYSVCDPQGAPLANANPITVMDPYDVAAANACMKVPALLIATNNFNFAVVAALAGAAPQGLCAAAGVSGAVATTGNPVGGWAPLGAPTQALTVTAGNLAWIGQARIARYKIFNDPVDNAPSLWRSTTGVFDPITGTAVGGPGSGIGTWQLVARGIEDMQVEYLDGAAAGPTPGGWSNVPTAVGCAQPTPPLACTAAEVNTIIREVRVTLSSRSMAQNVQGATLPGTGNPALAAIRGQLQAVIAPRQARVALQSRPLPEGIP